MRIESVESEILNENICGGTLLLANAAGWFAASLTLFTNDRNCPKSKTMHIFLKTRIFPDM